MEKLKVLSLFSGIGGSDLGLERAGMEVVAFCEKDKHCHKVLSKHWPNIPIFEDVTKLNKELLSNLKIDVIVGGFPCQDISLAGSRKGITKGERSSLWKEYWRIINEIRPRYAIIENVEYLRKNGLGIVLNDLSRIGYDAEWSVITARSVGLPHQRQRLFIISYPCGQRQYEYLGEGRHIQTDKEWEIAKIYSEGEGCQPKPIQIHPILSRGAFDHIRNSFPNQRAAVSSIRRVTDGVPKGLDENRRKQRIKQLGNAIVPQIAEIIGIAILEHEKSLII